MHLLRKYGTCLIMHFLPKYYHSCQVLRLLGTSFATSITIRNQMFPKKLRTWQLCNTDDELLFKKFIIFKGKQKLNMNIALDIGIIHFTFCLDKTQSRSLIKYP